MYDVKEERLLSKYLKSQFEFFPHCHPLLQNKRGAFESDFIPFCSFQNEIISCFHWKVKFSTFVILSIFYAELISLQPIRHSLAMEANGVELIRLGDPPPISPSHHPFPPLQPNSIPWLPPVPGIPCLAFWRPRNAFGIPIVAFSALFPSLPNSPETANRSILESIFSSAEDILASGGGIQMAETW